MSATIPAVTVFIKKKAKRSDASIGVGVGAGAEEDVQGAIKKQRITGDAVPAVPTATVAGNLSSSNRMFDLRLEPSLYFNPTTN